MSIPTNNLYNFVAQALENRYLIKYFYPWGQKGFANITCNDEDKHPNYFSDLLLDKPTVMCHDQEPLDFDLYNDNALSEQIHNMNPHILREYEGHKTDKSRRNSWHDLNLRWHLPNDSSNFWVLLHSELNSPEIAKYENTGLFKCAYWWAHAPIAIDWFRFARYDNRLKRQSQDIKANFLLYARETTGKRAYRKNFLTQLKNTDSVQLGSFNKYPISSNSSAIYDPDDFAYTNCSIVLETVNDRIHLTEKTLRPLACGHPFLLVNGHGALEKIRSYGFKTFHPFLDESYDLEPDRDKRMAMVIAEIDRIDTSSEKYQQWIWNGCQEIADYNKRLFFDDKFIRRVKTELQRTVREHGMPTLTHKRLRKISAMMSREYRLSMDQTKRRRRAELYLKLKSSSV